jgi:hypothetical protein
MLTDIPAEIISFPQQETYEAVQRKDVLSVIGCIQVHLMRIVAISPLIFDVQKNVVDHVLVALRRESITIDTTQERTMRELIQTVYRGMCGGIFHGIDVRRDAIQRMLREGSLLFQNILLIEEKKLTVLDRELSPPPTHDESDERAPAEAPPLDPEPANDVPVTTL